MSQRVCVKYVNVYNHSLFSEMLVCSHAYQDVGRHGRLEVLAELLEDVLVVPEHEPLFMWCQERLLSVRVLRTQHPLAQAVAPLHHHTSSLISHSVTLS